MYELRADDVTVWRGDHEPNQDSIDKLAQRLTDQGWNGTTMDLYRDGEFLQWALPVF